MNETSKHIEQAKKELAELEIVRGELAVQKQLFTPTMLGVLMENIQEGLDELVGKSFYDKDFSEKFIKSINNTIEAFTKQKTPEVKISNTVNVDLKPLQAIANDITKQNERLLSMLDTLSKGNSSADLHGMITGLVNKQVALLEKTETEIDYTEKLSELIAAVKEQRPPLLKLSVSKDKYGAMEVTPHYK